MCFNEDQARGDRADREAIFGALRDQLTRGGKSVIGDRCYRKYVKNVGRRFEIDEGRGLGPDGAVPPVKPNAGET